MLSTYFSMVDALVFLLDDVTPHTKIGAFLMGVCRTKWPPMVYSPLLFFSFST